MVYSSVLLFQWIVILPSHFYLHIVPPLKTCQMLLICCFSMVIRRPYDDLLIKISEFLFVHSRLNCILIFSPKLDGSFGLVATPPSTVWGCFSEVKRALCLLSHRLIAYSAQLGEWVVFSNELTEYDFPSHFLALWGWALGSVELVQHNKGCSLYVCGWVSNQTRCANARVDYQAN